MIAELKKIRELLTPDEHWVSEQWATDGRGYPVLPTDPTATCWCLLGAAMAVVFVPMALTALLATLEKTLVEQDNPLAEDLAAFNDKRGHAAVLKLLDDTILRLS